MNAHTQPGKQTQACIHTEMCLCNAKKTLVLYAMSSVCYLLMYLQDLQMHVLTSWCSSSLWALAVQNVTHFSSVFFVCHTQLPLSNSSNQTICIQVSIIEAVLNASPGASCREDRALSNLQQQWQTAYFNRKLFNSFMQRPCRGYYRWCAQMQIGSKWPTMCHSCSPSLPLQTLYVSVCLYLNSMVSSPAIPPTLSLVPLHLAVFSGARGAGFGLLSGGSESSVLLWAVWQAVPQTPGVWQPYQLLRPRTQAGKHRALPWLIITTSHTNRYTSRVSAITVIVVLLAS